MPWIDVARDICLRRPRPTQGCKVDDDDSCAEELCLIIVGVQEIPGLANGT
jgi:hypothetical protein